MAVGIDSVGARGNWASGTTFTCSVTISAANSNRALVVAIAWQTGAGVTCTGVASDLDGALTSAGTAASGGYNSEMYYLNAEPSSGTHTITVTMSGTSMNRAHAIAHSFYDVDQTTPVQNFNSTTATNALTITSASGNVTVMSVACNTNPTALTPGTINTTTLIGFSYDQPSGNSAFTWNAAAVRAASGLDVLAASGGGSPALRRFGGVPGMGQGQSFGRSW